MYSFTTRCFHIVPGKYPLIKKALLPHKKTAFEKYLAGNGLFDKSMFDFVIVAVTLLDGIGCTTFLVEDDEEVGSFFRKMGRFLIWTLDSGQLSAVVSFLGIFGIEGIEGNEGMLPSLTYFSKYVFPRV